LFEQCNRATSYFKELTPNLTLASADRGHLPRCRESLHYSSLQTGDHGEYRLTAIQPHNRTMALSTSTTTCAIAVQKDVPGLWAGVWFRNKRTRCIFISTATRGNLTQQSSALISQDMDGSMLCGGNQRIADAKPGNTSDKDGVAKKAHLGP
jgi:hypothetical protein